MQKIKRNVDKQSGITTYTSPDLKYISVIKQFKLNTVFVLHLHFEDRNQHFDATGASIEFEDGTIIKEGNVKVDCKQEVSEIVGGNAYTSSAHSGEYLLQSFFPVNDENISKFTSQKIVKIELGGTSRIIKDKDAARILGYIQCLKDKEL